MKSLKEMKKNFTLEKNELKELLENSEDPTEVKILQGKIKTLEEKIKHLVEEDEKEFFERVPIAETLRNFSEKDHERLIQKAICYIVSEFFRVEGEYFEKAEVTRKLKQDIYLMCGHLKTNDEVDEYLRRWISRHVWAVLNKEGYLENRFVESKNVWDYNKGTVTIKAVQEAKNKLRFLV